MLTGTYLSLDGLALGSGGAVAGQGHPLELSLAEGIAEGQHVGDGLVADVLPPPCTRCCWAHWAKASRPIEFIRLRRVSIGLTLLLPVASVWLSMACL